MRQAKILYKDIQAGLLTETDDGAYHFQYAPDYIKAYPGPIHVYRMTEEQAAKTAAWDRMAYAADVLKKNYLVTGKRWYADNT